MENNVNKSSAATQGGATTAKKKKKKKKYEFAFDEQFECANTAENIKQGCAKCGSEFGKNNPIKCIRKYSPLNLLFREDVDECLLLSVYNSIVCVNDTCNCCCDVKMDEVVNTARIAKFIWNRFV